jgi:putative transcriptional regulator
LRLFIGYAGWAPGQLDSEMARGSWRVLPASSELVFDADPQTLWKRLAPAQEQRAAL